MADSPAPRDGGRLSAPEGADRSVTAPDAPAVARDRRAAARERDRAQRDQWAEDAAESDRAIRRAWARLDVVPEPLRSALDALFDAAEPADHPEGGKSFGAITWHSAEMVGLANAVGAMTGSVIATDSPAVAEARRMAADYRRFGSSESADALDGVLAELDEARRELAGLPEWQCPSCGATTRARMADRVQANSGEGHDPERICCAHAADVNRLRASVEPRVWLEGDEVPAGVAVIDEPGVEDGGFWTASDLPGLFDRPVVEVHPPTPGAFAAAVAAERERRAAQSHGEPSGDPPPPNPVPEPSESRSDDLGRSHDPGAWQLPRGVQGHSVAAASLSPQLAQNAPEGAVRQSETGEGREAAHGGAEGAEGALDAETSRRIALADLVHVVLKGRLGDCPDNGDPDLVVCFDIAAAVTEAPW